MKKLIIVLSLLSITPWVFAQNYWFNIIESAESHSPISDIFIYNDNYYFGIIDIIDEDFEEYYAKVCKISPNGEISISPYFKEDYINLIGNINILDNGNLIGFGHVYIPEENDKFALWITEFTTNLDIVDQHIDTFDMNYSYIMNSFKNTRGNYYFQAATTEFPFSPVPYRGYLAEISQEKNTINDTSFSRVIYDIAPEFNDVNNIVITSYGLDESAGNMNTQINILDTCFNLIETPLSYDHQDLYYYTSIHNSNDSHYYLSGMALTGEGSFINSFSTYKIDSNFNELNVQFHDSIYHWLFTPDHNGIVTYEDILYAGASLEYRGMPYPVPNYFSLIKMDDDLNVIWRKFYGGDRNYCLSSINITNGGDLLLLGRSSELGSINEDVFIMKVNQNGLISNTNENPSIPIKNAVVMPNPGRDYLQLHTGIYPSKLLLFNISGKQVLEKEINSEISHIETTHLPSGTYIWQVENSQRIIENGKWIKK